MTFTLCGQLGCLLLVCVLSSLMCACQSACPNKCICSRQHQLVKCPEAELEAIPWNLPYAQDLKQLDLSGNRINSVISEIVSYTSLELLDLSDNEMFNIDDQVFDALPNLRFLNFHNNKLHSLTNNTFKGLSSLLKLDLSNNDLTSMGDGVFADLENLKELDLSGNGIIELTSLRGLENLRRLVLDDNQLTAFPSGALSHLRQLGHFSIKNNNLKLLPNDAFSSFSQLRHLDLSGNLLEELPTSAFHDTHLSFVPHLEFLDLSNNRLQSVPSSVFKFLSNLREIDLSQNPISIIEPDAFKGTELVRINQVRINSMPLLEVVRKYSFLELRDLQVMEMHSNYKLREIEPDSFFACTSLQEVDLHANALQTLSSNLFESDGLLKLDLRYNPWVCDCNFLWVKDVLHSIYGNSSHSYMPSHVTCSSPSGVAEKTILEVPDDKFECGTTEKTPAGSEFEDSIMIAIFVTTACILLIIGGILFFKFRSAMFTSPPESMDYQVYHNTCRASLDKLVSGNPNSSQKRTSSTGSRLDIISNVQMEDFPPPKRKPARKLRQVRFSEDLEEHREVDGLTLSD